MRETRIFMIILSYVYICFPVLFFTILYFLIGHNWKEVAHCGAHITFSAFIFMEDGAAYTLIRYNFSNAENKTSLEGVE